MANPWDAYCVSMKTYCTGANLMACAVMDKVGGAPMATDGIQATPEEVKAITGAIEQGQADSFRSNGFTVGGQRFALLNVDEDFGMLLGRGKKGNSFGTGALVVYNTGSTMLLAVGEPSANQGTIRTGVGKLSDYLKSCNM